MSIRQLVRRFGQSTWRGWPERAYLRPRYQQRLGIVREHLAECVDGASPGPVRILSMCAGDGRDVIAVARDHPRRTDISASLVELDPKSVAYGRRRAADAKLQSTVRFFHEDATVYTTYQRLGASDIVLVCGVWGHVPPDERTLLVRALGCLCKPGGSVIWTRGVSRGIARLHEIQAAFDDAAWESTRLSFTPDERWAVATYRYMGAARAVPSSGRIFNFTRAAGR